MGPTGAIDPSEVVVERAIPGLHRSPAREALPPSHPRCPADDAVSVRFSVPQIHSIQVEPPFCPCTWPTQENMRRPPRLARKARRRVPERRNSSGAPSQYWIYTRPRCARAHAIGLLMPSRPGIGAYSAPYRPRPWRECVCISDDSPKCPRACLANACMRPRRARTLPKPQPDALCCPDGALSL